MDAVCPAALCSSNHHIPTRMAASPRINRPFLKSLLARSLIKAIKKVTNSLSYTARPGLKQITFENTPQSLKFLKWWLLLHIEWQPLRTATGLEQSPPHCHCRSPHTLHPRGSLNNCLMNQKGKVVLWFWPPRHHISHSHLFQSKRLSGSWIQREECP